MTDDAVDVIDPDALDPETLRRVKKAVRGFRLADPSEQYTDLDEYSAGEHDAYASVLAMLNRWLDKQGE